LSEAADIIDDVEKKHLLEILIRMRHMRLNHHHHN